MSLKTFLNEMEDTMTREVVRKRLKRHNDWTSMESVNPVYLEQLDDIKKEKLIKAGVKLNMNLGYEFGYREGILYATELMNKNNYTKAELIKLIKLLPNCISVYTIGVQFALGFIDGLFGGDDKGNIGRYCIDTNRFTKKWRSAVLKNLTICL